MSVSQPAPKMLAMEALCTAAEAYSLILRIDELSRDGNQAEALRTLRLMAPAVASALPVLHGVIAAQRKAAEALNLSQDGSVRVLASIGIAAPHPDAANGEHASPPPKPSDGVA